MGRQLLNSRKHQWTTQRTHQRPGSSLRTTSCQPQWMTVVVVPPFTEFCEWMTRPGGRCPEQPLLKKNCDSGCGERIPSPLSAGTRGAAAPVTCYTLNMGITCNMLGKVNLSFKSDGEPMGFKGKNSWNFRTKHFQTFIRKVQGKAWHFSFQWRRFIKNALV